MNQLSNAFSLLELDVEDSREQITVAAAAGDDNSEKIGLNLFPLFPFHRPLSIVLYFHDGRF